jgi:hypothetical protein
VDGASAAAAVGFAQSNKESAMRPIVLQTLTWGTVAAAVSSALWLAWADNRGELPHMHTASRQASASVIAARNGSVVIAGLVSLNPLGINLKPAQRIDANDWLGAMSPDVAVVVAETTIGPGSH